MHSESYALPAIQHVIVEVQAQVDSYSDADCAPLQCKLCACLTAICAQTGCKRALELSSTSCACVSVQQLGYA